MPTLSRRAVLSRAAALAASQLLPQSRLLHAAGLEDAKAEDAIPVDVSVAWDRTAATISRQMLGLSYESTQLGAADFFSAANTELIALLKKLSPNGVLRLGGNLSEYTRWAPDAVPAAYAVPFRGVGADPSSGNEIKTVSVTPLAIRNLREFLDRTGWRAIYGLNLAAAEQERVVAEARFAWKTLGPHLIAFQLGNEPNHYVLNKLRAPGYSFADYFGEWSRIHAAILEAIPEARFAGPDVAEKVNWIEQFAQANPKGVVMLTGHHYAAGPPSDPAVTLDKLLAPDAAFERHIGDIETVARKARLPYVMSETNSCYNAGKAGVSDVFGAALWAADYILQLAQAGQGGVYFHGGGRGFYTPISGGAGEPFVPRPVYYGMLLCRDLQGSELAPVSMTSNAANVRVYAAKNPRRMIAINKGASDVVLRLPRGEKAVAVQRLQAPSLESKTGITWGAAPLRRAEQHAVRVPRYSAAVITVKPA